MLARDVQRSGLGYDCDSQRDRQRNEPSPSEAHIVIELYQNDRRRWPHLRSLPSRTGCDCGPGQTRPGSAAAGEQNKQSPPTICRRSGRTDAGLVCRSAARQSWAVAGEEQAGEAGTGRGRRSRQGQAADPTECRLPCAGCKLANRERALRPNDDAVRMRLPQQ